jgi:NAD-dependent SIR2 family protein deacetylase
MVALVETEVPVLCRWCRQPNHVFLEVKGSQREAFVSLVLCPECDSPVMPLIRRGVVCFGRMESRGEDLVWVASLDSKGAA